MKLILALLALAAFAHATGSMTEPQGADELQKELNGLNKQAEEALQKIDKLTSLPSPVTAQQMDAVKARVLRLANDDNFLQSVEALWKNEKRKELFLIQAGFFLFMLLFKAWRQSRAQHWFKKFLVGFACSVISWAGLIYVIPLIVLGKPFAVFTGTLWRVLVMGQ